VAALTTTWNLFHRIRVMSIASALPALLPSKGIVVVAPPVQASHVIKDSTADRFLKLISSPSGLGLIENGRGVRVAKIFKNLRPK